MCIRDSPKLFGVPFLIGMNWVILTTISGSISNQICKGRKIPSILLGSLLMLFIDFFIEPVAPTLDFWEFKDSIVPLSNYSGWLITGLLTQSFYQLLFKYKELNFSVNLYLAIFVFFLFLGLNCNNFRVTRFFIFSSYNFSFYFGNLSFV